MNQTESAAMTDEMRGIIDRAQNLLDATEHEVDGKVRAARRALLRGLAELGGEGGAPEADAEEIVRLLRENLRERPLRTLAAAFAAGAFLGLLLRRR